MKRYIYAYDSTVKRIVPHVIIDNWAFSLVTGKRFKYENKEDELK